MLGIARRGGTEQEWLRGTQVTGYMMCGCWTVLRRINNKETKRREVLTTSSESKNYRLLNWSYANLFEIIKVNRGNCCAHSSCSRCPKYVQSAQHCKLKLNRHTLPPYKCFPSFDDRTLVCHPGYAAGCLCAPHICQQRRSRWSRSGVVLPSPTHREQHRA